MEAPWGVGRATEAHRSLPAQTASRQDPVNSQGGKWRIRLRKGLGSRYWEELVLAIIGEQFDVGDEICGAVISVRAAEDVLSVWTKTADNIEATTQIRDQLRRILHLPGNIPMDYKKHQDTPPTKPANASTASGGAAAPAQGATTRQHMYVIPAAAFACACSAVWCVGFGRLTRPRRAVCPRLVVNGANRSARRPPRRRSREPRITGTGVSTGTRELPARARHPSDVRTRRPRATAGGSGRAATSTGTPARQRTTIAGPGDCVCRKQRQRRLQERVQAAKLAMRRLTLRRHENRGERGFAVRQELC